MRKIEYGLFGPGLVNRTRLSMFFEQVPNESVNDLCSGPNEYLVLKRASCIAKKYHTYLVINMGDVQYCDPSVDSQCPSGMFVIWWNFLIHILIDRRYLYNTNVVFDRNGNVSIIIFGIFILITVIVCYQISQNSFGKLFDK